MKTNVKMGLSQMPIEKKIVKTRFIVASMTGNANFGTPSPTLATITTNVNALEAASIAAKGGGKDDTANMRAKEAVLDLSLKLLGYYVEGIASANPANAEAIILSAGMDVRGKGGNFARGFEVSATGNIGEVRLQREGVSRGSYEYQMSIDISTDANWQRIYSGTRARIVMSGLVSGTRYYFRAAGIDKNGLSPWSSVKTMIAL
ncbi:MAG: fibronectin type III domain-containing protein [Bacteroidetes bacterium]|nr:fibronectin type III domain-containing protein [Bacteroidota bacterium]MBI3481919.1 fibronectin type III domain-containing protein [Bacteroidota bacterium]